jgi:hypothetical protein
MELIKYRDERNGERDYSWFWTHQFVDTDHAVVVSPIFATRDQALAWQALALAWGQDLRRGTTLGETDT